MASESSPPSPLPIGLDDMLYISGDGTSED